MRRPDGEEGRHHGPGRPGREPGAVYHGGDIVTMAGEQPTYVEAVVVRDGKIEFAGASAEAMTKAGAGHQMVDLGGKTLLPSFIDAHSHYINSLLVANQCNPRGRRRGRGVAAFGFIGIVLGPLVAALVVATVDSDLARGDEPPSDLAVATGPTAPPAAGAAH